MRTVYGIGTLMVATAVIAVAVVQQVSFLLFIFTIQFALVAIGMALLERRIPKTITEASNDNCSRIDGSFSARRNKEEMHARSKVRLDLLAVFLYRIRLGLEHHRIAENCE